MMSDDHEGPAGADGKLSDRRYRLIVAGIIFVGICAVVAIVLPLVLDTCDCPPSTPAIRAPTLPPTIDMPSAPPAPTIPAPPTTPSIPTLAPVFIGETQSPTTERLSQFIETFLVPVSGEEVFQDRTSPQYRAAQFLADNDILGPSLDDSAQLGDRYALSTFYYSMDGDDSWFSCYQADANCTTGSSWLNATSNHCDWSAISCDDSGRVVDIFFATSSGNGLVGSIPEEISLMSELRNLVAVNNLIGGSFPSSFGAMSNLRRVVLSTNVMSGTIPEGFLTNSPLELFLVSNNRFTGKIPASFGSIVTMTQLQLANNNFDGTIPPELGGMELLGTLDLSQNIRLRGSIPPEIFGLANLENFYLNENPNILGRLDSSIGGLSSINSLQLRGTGIQGSLPSSLFNLGTISELDISNADFSGTLPEDFSLIRVSLRVLNLSGNRFSGAIPIAFDLFAVLNELYLDDNDLTGQIPTSLCVRRGDGRNDLNILTADCNEVSCSCCTNVCFESS